MKKIIKSRIFWWFVGICILASIIIAVFGLSNQIKLYQINSRNKERKSEVNLIIQGVQTYISTYNNLPTTANPEVGSFLPDLLFEGNKPSGGVSVQTLESMEGILNIDNKDPLGNPYYVGIYQDQVIVYTTTYELYPSGNDVYFETLKVNNTIKQ